MYHRKNLQPVIRSQRGGQAGALAGIDSRVTAALLRVPALTDIGGMMDNGRRGGWPKPYASKADADGYRDILPYYDVALLLAHSGADLLIEAGLVDLTCPASCVAAGFNNAKSENKSILFFPYRPHGARNVDSRHMNQYETLVNERITEFIDKHLK